MRLNDISNYEFSAVKPYQQYADCAPFVEFCKCLNERLESEFKCFLQDFKDSLDFSKKGVNKDYLSFYLQRYFGLSLIPNPSEQKTLTNSSYDDNLNYDESVIYDDIILQKRDDIYNLSADKFLHIAKVILNYDFKVFNLEFLDELLSSVYFAYEKKDLDFGEVDLEFGDTLKVFLPKCEAFKCFVLITRLNP